MAKCELSIELEEPTRVYRGGDVVRGHVNVRVDRDVKCKALTIKSIWATHGQGNVDTGTHREVVVFQGNWRAGHKERFPFALECGHWPPTYHGKLLNVDHYIHAQADIPWALDPKAKAPFQLAPTPGHGDSFQPVGRKSPGETPALVKWVLGGIFGSVFVVMAFFFLINPAMWLCGSVMLFFAGLWWFFTKWMPKWKLGEVEFELLTPVVAPGQNVRSRIALAPRGNVAINGVRMKIRSQEVVVRGSGTDRRTSRHELGSFERNHEATVLTGGRQHVFELDFQLPDDAPLSLDLSDNDLVYTIETSIDIPRWPDWKRTEKLTVLPLSDADSTPATPPIKTRSPTTAAPQDVSNNESRHATTPLPQPPQPPQRQSSPPPQQPASTPSSTAPNQETDQQQAGVSFADTAAMVRKVRTDFDQLHRVIDAVAGTDMQVTVKVGRMVTMDSSDAFIGYPGGFAFEAVYEPEYVEVKLFVPETRKSEFERSSGTTWNGWGTVVGYDNRVGRLQVKVL